MLLKRLFFIVIIYTITIVGYAGENDRVKENSAKKTEDVLRRADAIIRKASAIEKKSYDKTYRSGNSNLKPGSAYSKSKKPAGKSGINSTKQPAKKSFPSLMVMDCGGKAPAALIRFMMTNNSNLDSNYVSYLIKTYISESRREGVNHDVAVCQMCLETGFLRFNGSVSRYQNNFCGLGAVNAWSEGDWFRSIEEGVRAHIQHLKAYASKEPLKSPPVDKRFVHVQRGTVNTIHDLTGKWASDPDYGIKIDYLLKTLYTK